MDKIPVPYEDHNIIMIINEVQGRLFLFTSFNYIQKDTPFMPSLHDSNNKDSEIIISLGMWSSLRINNNYLSLQ